MPRPPSNKDRAWMTTPEVADMFEVTVGTVRDWIAAGKLPAYKVNGYNRLLRNDVLAYAREKYGFDPADPPPV